MPRESHRPPAHASREEALAQSLVSLLAKLAVLPDSTLRRELRAIAILYEGTVHEWKEKAPPDAEIDAMVDRVVELHKRVLAAKHATRTEPARSRRRASSNRPRT